MPTEIPILKFSVIFFMLDTETPREEVLVKLLVYWEDVCHCSKNHLTPSPTFPPQLFFAVTL